MTPEEIKRDYKDLPKAEMPMGRPNYAHLGKEMVAPKEMPDKVFDKEKKGR